MDYNFSNFSQAAKFDYQLMRRDREFRRQMLRWTIFQILDDREHSLGDWIERFSAFCGYDTKSEKDQRNLDQCCFYIREIVRGWPHLDDETKDSFIANDIVPSTLALRMAEARKARRAS